MCIRDRIKVSIAGAIISLLGWILTLVYLTLAAGHKEGEEGIALSSIDRIKTCLLYTSPEALKKDFWS